MHCDPTMSHSLKLVLDEIFKGVTGCGFRFTHFDYRHFEIDHIVPKSKGGQDDDANLQLLCGNCNRIKSDKSMGHLKASLKERGILS